MRRKPPNAAELERLALLIEECSEVSQAATKVIRHGWDSCHPRGHPYNRAALAHEIGDLLHIIDRILDARDVLREDVGRASAGKDGRVRQYTHFQEDSLLRRKKP